MVQRTANAQNGPALRSVYQALSLTNEDLLLPRL